MNDDEKQLENERMIQLTEEIGKETDRAAVILAAAYLDVLLRDMIESVMSGEDAIIKELLMDANAPLGTFSSRIKIAYCLRLINKEGYDNLNKIRRIRNDFAHQLIGISLDTSPTKERISSLTISDKNISPSSPRDRFTIVSVRLMVEFIIFTRRTRSQQV